VDAFSPSASELTCLFYLLQIHCIKNPNKEEDIDYYSMFNAPLMKIRQFEAAEDFIAFARTQGLGSPSQEGVRATMETEQAGERNITGGESSQSSGSGVVARKRGMVAIEMTDASLDISSAEATTVLQEQGLYLVMGAEKTGVDQSLLDCCTHSLEIPSLSASVNVACAFSMALTAMLIADRSAGSS
jgi:hypothetical protein